MDEASKVIIARIRQTHQWMLNAVAPLEDEELNRPPSQSAPPIGWHLWHAARWADRMQASLPGADHAAGQAPDPANDIWTRENLADVWGLECARLGKLATGVHMEHAYAAAVVTQAGKDRIFAYAERAFAALNDALSSAPPEQMDAPRISVMFDPSAPEPDGGVPAKYHTTIAGDLGFVFSHSSRHLGMIEALRGLTGRDGSASA